MKLILTLLSTTMIFSFSSYALTDAAALKLLRKSRCTTCHAVDKDKIGPSYQSVSKHYNNPSAETKAYLKGLTASEYLIEKIRVGTKKHNKNWIKSEKGRKFGIMTSNKKRTISDEDLKEVVNYILSLK